MDVILLERIGHLGQMGDVVRVKDGYARNFLLPSGKALRATSANRQKFERDREMLETRNAERRAAAQGDAGHIDGKAFVLIRQAGESGQLYGSVSTRDIAEAASAAGTHIERNQVLLDTPIKTIGLHQVRIALHPEVVIEVTANVARSADEAAAQARGEVLIGSASDREEARIAAEALFQQETEAEAEAEAEAEPPEESVGG
jgi:large subunit ribosomal protein L9